MSPARGRLQGAGAQSTATERGGTPWLTLEPDPMAARHARSWVVSTLAGWPEHSVETARLLMSEVVTNAVLHARTAIEIRMQRQGSKARFEIADGHPAGPLPKHFEPDAVTGRGLRLLVSMAGEWGVSRTDRGKVVWFVVEPQGDFPSSGARVGAGQPAASRTASEAAFSAAVSQVLAEWPEVPIGEPAREGATAARADRKCKVALLGFPLDLYFEAEEHSDAVMRELTLIVQSAADPGQSAMPWRLLELADEMRDTFATAASDFRVQVERALQRGERALDLEYLGQIEGWQMLLVLADQLDELDRYCEEGDLLTLAPSPDVRRFRRWCAQQVTDQLAGLAPRPWRGGR